MEGTATSLNLIIGRAISLIDSRTGAQYRATITNAKYVWGKVRIAVNGSNTWFEPYSHEVLESHAEPNRT